MVSPPKWTERGLKMGKYEYYEISASKCIKGDSGNEFDGPHGDAEYDNVNFKVRGTSHSQHIWNSTYINGLSKDAETKIQQLKNNGYDVCTFVGGRSVKVNN
jgi:hypothetical protein